MYLALKQLATLANTDQHSPAPQEMNELTTWKVAGSMWPIRLLPPREIFQLNKTRAACFGVTPFTFTLSSSGPEHKLTQIQTWHVSKFPTSSVWFRQMLNRATGTGWSVSSLPVTVLPWSHNSIISHDTVLWAGGTKGNKQQKKVTSCHNQSI